MQIIIALLFGLLAWFIANLFLPAGIATVIGILVFVIYAFGSNSNWRSP